MKYFQVLVLSILVLAGCVKEQERVSFSSGNVGLRKQATYDYKATQLNVTDGNGNDTVPLNMGASRFFYHNTDSSQVYNMYGYTTGEEYHLLVRRGSNGGAPTKFIDSLATHTVYEDTTYTFPTASGEIASYYIKILSDTTIFIDGLGVLQEK